MTVALGVGSRGVNNIAECVKAVVTQLKALGAEPFVFPSRFNIIVISCWSNYQLTALNNTYFVTRNILQWLVYYTFCVDNLMDRHTTDTHGVCDLHFVDQIIYN